MKKMDVVQTASQFAHVELMALAELGVGSIQEARDFVQSGATGLGGDLPTCADGGWLSYGQPSVSCVMDSLIATIRQLRRELLGVQVPDADLGLVHANGGIQACHSVTILGRSA